MVFDDDQGVVASAVPEPVNILVDPEQVLNTPVIVGKGFTVTVAVPEAELLQAAILPSDTDTSE